MHDINSLHKHNQKVNFMWFRKIGLCIAILASLSACGGGASDSGNNSNTLVCTKPSGTQSITPLDTVIRLFIAVYQLDSGQIDEFGAFIITSTIIFEFAADNSASVDGNKTPITSACYDAANKKLALQLGQSDTLILSEGGKAIGTINGKVVRSKTP
jgi:hypothetical protein